MAFMVGGIHDVDAFDSVLVGEHVGEELHYRLGRGRRSATRRLSPEDSAIKSNPKPSTQDTQDTPSVPRQNGQP